MSNTQNTPPEEQQGHPKSAKERFSFYQYTMIAALCFGSFMLGKGIQQHQERCQIAIAEQGAVALDAALDRQGMPKETLEKEIRQPILAILKKYADQGYLVVDVSKDEQGNMAIAALPEAKHIDITKEMSEAIKQATEQRKAQQK